MQEPLISYCRTGTVHFMLFPDCASGAGPVVETFAQLALDSDLEVIEVGPIDEPTIRREVAQIARLARVGITSSLQQRMHDDGLDLAAEEAQRQKALRQLYREIEGAAELGAETIEVVSGPDPGPAGRDDALRRLVRSLQELSACAAQAGMEVVLKPLDRDMDRKALIGPTAEAVELCRQVECSNFGLLIDHSCLALMGERPNRALPLARECLRHVHIGNCVRDPASRLYGDQHPPFGCAKGANDTSQLAEFLRVLMDINFFNTRQRPVMSFEVRPTSSQSAELVLAGTKRSLRAAWLEV